ncbi:MAG: Miniconductance mechanosensitive channel MscM precursor [Syntrophorhabdaceae bacterium PtaU1.Bin034]|nr:MAG: Miniconductance mechanosensitive channel MscM precursor [Syntrophorhabdaceae bacterium PtaU1.Bin034]
MKENLVRSLKELINLQVISETIIVMAATWLALAGIQRLFRLLADKFPRRRVQISSIFPLLRLAVWLGVIGFIISVVINPRLNTLVALSATAGVALGIGAQELVKNVLAGVMIMFDRPYLVGDMIKIDEHYGEVVHIGLRASKIHTFDDSIITFPNGILLNKAVINSNSGALVEQVVVEFFLPANVNVPEAKELMLEAALCSPYVYRKNPVVVLVEDRFDYGFLTAFKVKVYVVDVRFERLIASDITERIKDEVRKRGILPKESLISA